MSRLIALTAFLAAVALTYAPAIVGLPFYTKGEPREAVVVARMVDSGDFILPHRTATEIPTKPPLFHWLGATATKLTGHVNESSVRLPSLAASLLVLMLMVLVGRRLFDSTTAWTAAIALATTQQWIASSVTARVDMVLSAAIAIAMLSFSNARARGAPWPDLFWFGCALAVLAKGPVGLVLPMLCTLVVLACRRDFAYLISIRPLRASLLLGLALAWYALAWHRGGDTFAHKVLSENVYRMIDADAGDDLGHRHSMLFYIPALLGGLAPWSLLLPAAVMETWRERRSLDEPRVFALAWLMTTVVFFSLAASKRPAYLLSCYPAACLLIGGWLSRRFAEENDTRIALPRGAAKLACAISIAVATAGAAMALQSAGIPVLDLLRFVVSAGDAANLIPAARSLEAHRALILSWFACTLVALSLFSRAVSRGAWRASFATVAIMIAGSTALIAATVFRDLARTQSVKPFIADAVAHLSERDPLYYYEGMNGQGEVYFYKAFEYAAGFYAGRPLSVLEHIDVPAGGSTWFITAEPTLDVLRRTAASERDGAPETLRVVSRFTYGDNPRRTPVVLVEARRE